MDFTGLGRGPAMGGTGSAGVQQWMGLGVQVRSHRGARPSQSE